MLTLIMHLIMLISLTKHHHPDCTQYLLVEAQWRYIMLILNKISKSHWKIILKAMDQRVQWCILSLKLGTFINDRLFWVPLSSPLFVSAARKIRQWSDVMNSSLNTSSAFCPCAHVYSDLRAHAHEVLAKNGVLRDLRDSGGCSTWSTIIIVKGR